jgi:hypothetical protein
MARTIEQLNDIFDRTSGKCHICHGTLAWSNYGKHGRRGAWEVDHSRARARGGSERGQNLFPAHTDCNRSKRDGSTRAARARFGMTRVPLSHRRRTEARIVNGLGGAGLGAMFGGVLFGRAGAWIGAVVVGALGASTDPDDLGW